MLIDARGHVKLTDFGLARITVSPAAEPAIRGSTPPLRTPGQVLSLAAPLHFSSEGVGGAHGRMTPLGVTPLRGCTSGPQRARAQGTPDYLAPEAVLGREMGQAGDWWAVGVCLYEFVVGIPPFAADDPHKIFDNICHQATDLDMLDVSGACTALIESLLHKDPTGRPRASYIKRHPFFHNLDFAALRDIPAPFVPVPTDQTDTSYFERMCPHPSCRTQCRALSSQPILYSSAQHSPEASLQ